MAWMTIGQLVAARSLVAPMRGEPSVIKPVVETFVRAIS
jgi:hypothetical protein